MSELITCEHDLKPIGDNSHYTNNIYYKCSRCGEEFHQCYECGSELTWCSIHRFHTYCFDCSYKLSYCIRKANTELRLRLNPNEFYETPGKALSVLGEVLETHLSERLPKGSTIWEPCDGNRKIGIFLESMGFNVISSDIQPRCEGVAKYDFLEAWPGVAGESYPHPTVMPASVRSTSINRSVSLMLSSGTSLSPLRFKCQATVFNPPFTHFQKNKRWLTHALECVDLVIALLPHNFEYVRKFNKFPLWQIEHIQEKLLFRTPYEPKPLKLQCNWFIWDKFYKKDTTFWNIADNEAKRKKN